MHCIHIRFPYLTDRHNHWYMCQASLHKTMALVVAPEAVLQVVLQVVAILMIVV